MVETQIVVWSATQSDLFDDSGPDLAEEFSGAAQTVDQEEIGNRRPLYGLFLPFCNIVKPPEFESSKVDPHPVRRRLCLSNYLLYNKSLEISLH